MKGNTMAKTSIKNGVEIKYEIPNKVNIRPLYDRVIISPIQDDEKTAGGLFIPESAKEKPMLGEVVAVGLGKKDE
jgi:hypothetical protein